MFVTQYIFTLCDSVSKLAEFKFTAVFLLVNPLDFNFTGLFELHVIVLVFFFKKKKFPVF